MPDYRDIDPNLSNVANATRLGVNESTIRRWKRKAADSDTFFDVPNQIITSRGRTTRLPDGSYEKITYRPQDLARIESQSTLFDDAMQALDNYKATPSSDLQVLPHTEVFSASDFQIGKAMESGGGTTETVERVMSSVQRFKERISYTRPEAVVITDVGDVIENMWNVPGHQLSTNDLDLTEQIRVARRLYIEMFKELSPMAPRIYSVSVPSNHGQVRIGAKDAVGAVDNDFGIEISHQLEDIFKESNSEALRNVAFIRPDKFQETAVLTTSGTKLAFHHGHQTKGGLNGHDIWWANQDHGRMPGWDADILIVGHYHTLKVEQSGDGRWIISVSASEPSSDYFALGSGKRSKRGVTCFSVSNGIWSNLEIV